MHAAIAELAIVAVTMFYIARLILAVVTPEVIGTPLFTTSGFTLDVFGALFIGLPVVWLMGLGAWGAWLARVIDNVPALGGGWTRSSSNAAFVSSIVPLYNLWWSIGAIREVLELLSPPGRARWRLHFAWWTTLVAAILPQIAFVLALAAGPAVFLGYQFTLGLIVTGLVDASGPEVDAGIVVLSLFTALVVLAAMLAIALVEHIERLQTTRASELGLLGESGAASETPDLTGTGVEEPTVPVDPPPSRSDEAAPSIRAEPAEPSATDDPGTTDTVDLGPHADEVETFVASVGLLNRDEVTKVHHQGLASGLVGGTRGSSLLHALDAAAASSGLEAAREEARSLASRAASRSSGRFGNRYMVADDCAGLWAEAIVLRHHLSAEMKALAFEPWREVLIAPEWLEEPAPRDVDGG